MVCIVNINDDSRIIRMAVQVVASPTIIELTNLEVSVMLLENIVQASLMMMIIFSCNLVFP